MNIYRSYKKNQLSVCLYKSNIKNKLYAYSNAFYFLTRIRIVLRLWISLNKIIVFLNTGLTSESILWKMIKLSSISSSKFIFSDKYFKKLKYKYFLTTFYQPNLGTPSLINGTRFWISAPILLIS